MHFKRFTFLNKLRNHETTMYLLGGIILLPNFIWSLKNNDFKLVFVVITVLSLILYLCLKIEYDPRKSDKTYPVDYSLSIYGFCLSSFLWLIIFSIPETFLIRAYLLILCLFVYAISVYIYFRYFLEKVYILIVKKIFPMEKSEVKHVHSNPSLKTLSMYIALREQKIYINLQILIFTIVSVFSVYITLLIFKISETYGNVLKDIPRLADWLNAIEWVSLSNALTQIQGGTRSPNNSHTIHSKQSKSVLVMRMIRALFCVDHSEQKGKPLFQSAKITENITF